MVASFVSCNSLLSYIVLFDPRAQTNYSNEHSVRRYCTAAFSNEKTGVGLSPGQHRLREHEGDVAASQRTSPEAAEHGAKVAACCAGSTTVALGLSGPSTARHRRREDDRRRQLRPGQRTAAIGSKPGSRSAGHGVAG